MRCLVEQSKADANGLQGAVVVGLYAVVVGLDVGAGVDAFHPQGEEILGAELATSPVGIIPRQIRHKHLLRIVGGGIGQLQVGLRRRTVGGLCINPQTSVEEAVAALEAEATRLRR